MRLGSYKFYKLDISIISKNAVNLYRAVIRIDIYSKSYISFKKY